MSVPVAVSKIIELKLIYL